MSHIVHILHNINTVLEGWKVNLINFITTHVSTDENGCGIWMNLLYCFWYGAEGKHLKDTTRLNGSEIFKIQKLLLFLFSYF